MTRKVPASSRGPCAFTYTIGIIVLKLKLGTFFAVR